MSNASNRPIMPIGTGMKTNPQANPSGTPANPTTIMEPDAAVLLHMAMPMRALTAARSATTNDSNMMTRSSIPAALNWLGFALSVVILTSSTILFAVIYVGLTAWLAEFQLHVLFYLIVLPVILTTIAGLAVPMRQLLDGGRR